jgi:hypothetical protein
MRTVIKNKGLKPGVYNAKISNVKILKTGETEIEFTIKRPRVSMLEYTQLITSHETLHES